MLEAILKYLNGTPASYSVDNDEIIAWESDKKKPTKARLKKIMAEIQAEKEVDQKKEKAKEEILRVASITDQINLMANVLDALTAVVEKNIKIQAGDKKLFKEAREVKGKIKKILDNVRK